MSAARVAAVIPVHGGRERTVACLRSLRDQAVTVHPIVVDDGSPDDTAAVISREHPEVELLSGDGDLWWAGAMNAGVRRALDSGFDHVLSLNNDCVLQAGAVEALLDATSDGRTIAGAQIRFADEPQRVLFAGGTLVWDGSGPHNVGWREVERGQFAARVLSDWLPGMCVLVPAAAYRDAGRYDDRRFPQYWSDVDFSLRARRAGYALVVASDAVAWNDRTQTMRPLGRTPDLATVWYHLSSRRSRYQLGPTLRFHLRHCPPTRLPRSVLGCYRPVLAGVRRRIVTIMRRR